MKKYTILLVVLLATVFAPGCNMFRDQIDELYSEVEQLKASDQDLRQQLGQLNSALSDLQKIVSAMQTGLFIKSVVSLSDEERPGYLITLSNGESFTIRDGRNGQDGTTPVFSVIQAADGAFYWTVDGEILKDADGKPVRADGITPVFDIHDDCWFISLDGGATWKNLGPATGADGSPGAPGDQIFSSVDYTPDENVVTFVLSDGTRLTLPCYQPISISFSVPDNETSIAAGETVKIEYTLSFGDDNTLVTVSSDGNYIATIEKRDNTSGSILITCPGLYMDGHVNVMAFDGVGYASIAVISFYEKQIIFNYGPNYHVSSGGTQLAIPLSFNFGYSLKVDNDAESWISILKTRAGQQQQGVIQLGIARNDGQPRTGKVYVYPDNSLSGAFAVITISQDGAYFEIGESSLVFKAEGGNAQVDIQTSKNISADVPSEASSWVQTTLTKDGEQYRVSLLVTGNTGHLKRQTSIPVRDTRDGSVLATIEIMQLTEEGQDEMDMVFEVRASENNDYTVYLPVKGADSDNDFTINWGDGVFERVNASSPNAGAPVSHHYSGITEAGQSFRVILSGTIRKLYSEDIPRGKRTGITAVLQWGKTGLREMNYAFKGQANLTLLGADETLAFGEVIDFYEAFSECPRLTDLSPHLFYHATKAQSFNSVFRDCISLKVIPARLFSSCQSAQYFQQAFHRCTSLERVPEGLFSHCGNAISFEWCFGECRNISSIAPTVFEACTNAGDFSYTFYNCSQVESIPEALFADCPSATRFWGTFNACWMLQDIPGNLFRNNTQAIEFGDCFISCNALTAIPEGLLDSCAAASVVTQMFAWCGQIKTVPTNLFDKLRKITQFERCFAGNYGWTGESPYTLVNGKKVHLYERKDYPDYFVTPSFHSYCFESCMNLTDWEAIPSDWR